MQPALSLFGMHKHCGFRPVFSLTLFMVPVVIEHDRSDDPGWSVQADREHIRRRVKSRRMAGEEIFETVQAGWTLAGSRPLGVRPKFEVSGPLGDYLAALDRSALANLDVSASWHEWTYRAGDGTERKLLTLRQLTEVIFFAVALRMVQGPDNLADRQTREKVGDRVLTALSASRASSVVVVDEKLKKDEVRDPKGDRRFPGSLASLMDTVSGPTRVAPRRRYRLDRTFFDEDGYAIGVLPGNRCVVVTTDKSSQRGYQESGLLQAGWIAYMVIGAATATGMMRAIYHDIEQANRSQPSEIAGIEREVVVDLHEIYDLDITWEVYRHRYRLLRDRLGITRDYEALQSKLQALLPGDEHALRGQDADVADGIDGGDCHPQRADPRGHDRARSEQMSRWPAKSGSGAGLPSRLG